MARTYILIDQQSRKIVFAGSDQACLECTGKEENKDVTVEMDEVMGDNRNDDTVNYHPSI